MNDEEEKACIQEGQVEYTIPTENEGAVVCVGVEVMETPLEA